jgi:hypothetical protein
MTYNKCCQKCSNLEFFPFCISKCRVLESYKDNPEKWKLNKKSMEKKDE